MARRRAHRIGTNGSATAKPDFALPAVGGCLGVYHDLAERAKAGGKDFRRDANARKPGVFHHQQRKSGNDRAVCDASTTGYVCEKGACEGGATSQKGAAAAGIERAGCVGAAFRRAVETSARAGGLASGEGGGQNGFRG